MKKLTFTFCLVMALTIAVIAQPCPQPIDLGATNITENSADIFWTSFSGLSDIEFGLSGFTPTGVPTHTGVTSPFDMTGLTVSTAYAFYVRDDCGVSGYSTWIGPYSFSTMSNLPYAPFNPSPTNLASGVSVDADLTWDFGDNTETYDVYFGTDNPPLAKVIDDAAGGAIGSYDPGTMNYSTSYYWYVVARNSAKAEVVGLIWTFTTQASCPQVYAGADTTISEGVSYSISDATATNFSTLFWTTSGDGTFSDSTVLNPTYSPGPSDIVSGFAELCLEALPINPCTNSTTDCMTISIAGSSVAIYVRDSILNGSLTGVNLWISETPLPNTTVARDFSPDIPDFPLPYSQTWVVMIDEYPEANFGHPVRWVFLEDGIFSNHIIFSDKTFPPTLWSDLVQQDFHCTDLTSLGSEPCPIIAPEGIIHFEPIINSTSKSNECLYAVLVSGGGSADMNYAIYPNNLKRMYKILVNSGYNKNNIFVYYANEDPLDLDNEDGDYSDVTGSDLSGIASKSNIQNKLQELCTALDPTDKLFVYFTNHGEEGGAAVLWDFNEGGTLQNDEKISPEEMSSWTNNCNVGRDFYIFDQCFSGAFIAPLSAPGHPNSAVYSAASANEPSYGDEYMHRWFFNINNPCFLSMNAMHQNVGSISSSKQSAEGTAGNGDENICTCSNVTDYSDLWAKDTDNDVGDEPNSLHPPWLSEDIWVRNYFHDGSVWPTPHKAHQDPRYNTSGLKNYVYVQIRNRGTQPYINNGTKQVNLYWAKASLNLIWEKPWDGLTWYPNPVPATPNKVLMGDLIGTANIPSIDPGDSYYLEFEWDPPDPDTYEIWFPDKQDQFCLLARIVTPSFLAEGMTIPEGPILRENVRNNNNIVWKNVTVVGEDLKKSGFLVGNYSLLPSTKKFVFTVPDSEDTNNIFDIATVKIKLQSSLYQLWEAGGKQGSNFIEESDSSIIILDAGGFISNLTIGADSIYGISVEFQRDSLPSLPLSAEYNMDVQQVHEYSDTIDGGVRFFMNQGFLDPNRYADLTILLEGPFNGIDMNTTLNDYGVLPLAQPYNTAPWNYPGTESVASIPNPDIVDWVLVELRDATETSLATPETKIAQQAAFLRNDGKVIDLLGNPELNFGPLTIANNLYVVVYHRNHLSLTSNARGQILEAGQFIHNFSTGSSQAYGDTLGHKQIGPGIWGMIGGDGNADGLVDMDDKNPLWELEAGTQGYIASDYDFDLQSRNQDKDDIWNPNFGSGSQVPGGYGFTCGDLLLDPRDAQSYETVLIGDQCWMAQNLNIGTMINGSSSQTDNAVIEKYCYSNNTSNCDTYGGLYQWDEAMQYSTTPEVQGICPTGWHLPADAEWKTMEMELGMTQAQADALGWRGTDEGGKLKETGTTNWSSPNTGATNLSGFTGLPGGNSSGGSFSNLTNYSYFWSSTSTASDTKAWDRLLGYNTTQVHRDDNVISYGFSVRCLKN